MRTVFLSHSLDSRTPGFGGKSAFESEAVRSMARGDSCNQSVWRLSNHIGTHIDAPLHFSQSGCAIDSVPAEEWVFSKICLLDVEVGAGRLIGPAHCEGRISGGSDLLLLRTGFERYRDEALYWQENPGLSADLGEWLRREHRSVRAIGFDALSATSYAHRDAGRDAHRAFLDPSRAGAPVMIIEDMSLAPLTTTPRIVIVAPLRVAGADGAPVTVIAQMES